MRDSLQRKHRRRYLKFLKVDNGDRWTIGPRPYYFCTSRSLPCPTAITTHTLGLAPIAWPGAHHYPARKPRESLLDFVGLGAWPAGPCTLSSGPRNPLIGDDPLLINVIYWVIGQVILSLGLKAYTFHYFPHVFAPTLNFGCIVSNLNELWADSDDCW